MIAEGTKDFSPAYSAWFGKPVVLLVVIRRCHVPMPCHIVAESVADVRVRISQHILVDVSRGYFFNFANELWSPQYGIQFSP